MALTSAQQLLTSATPPVAPITPVAINPGGQSPASSILAQAAGGQLSGPNNTGLGDFATPLLAAGGAGLAGVGALAASKVGRTAASTIPNALLDSAASAVTSAPRGAESLLEYAPYKVPAGVGEELATKGGFLANKLKFLDAIPGANMAESKLGLGAGVAIGGQVLGGLADAQNFGGENSNWDQGITGAIKGLGLGGGAALALGMSGPAGWAVAGTAALLGGFLNAQKEGGTTEERMQKSVNQSTKTIQTLGTQFGLNQTDLDNIMLQHQATTQLLLQSKDKKGLEAYISQLSSTLPQEMLAYKQQRDQATEQNKRQLSMQATFAPIFNSIQSRSAQDNQTAYANAVSAADQLANTSPQLASLIKQNASIANTSSDSLMAAYAAQMATVPNQATSAGYYQGQNLMQQYSLPGTQQISQPGTLTKSQQNQLAQLQLLQSAQQG